MRSLVAATTVAVTMGLMSLSGASSATAADYNACLRIVNVAPWDVLNIRARPSAKSRIVNVIHPDDETILKLDAPCSPKWKPWGERWCRVTEYYDATSVSGWVKARFVRDTYCP